MTCFLDDGNLIVEAPEQQPSPPYTVCYIITKYHIPDIIHHIVYITYYIPWWEELLAAVKMAVVCLDAEGRICSPGLNKAKNSTQPQSFQQLGRRSGSYMKLPYFRYHMVYHASVVWWFNLNS